MKNITKLKVTLKKSILGFAFLFSASVPMFAQNTGMILENDSANTGPFQKVRVNVIQNDVVPCNNFVLQIISVLNPSTEGTATVLSGGIIEFMPGINCRNTMVNITYQVSCNGQQDMAILAVRVTEYNYPVNIIDKNAQCVEIMPTDIPFGIRRKFSTENGSPSSGYCIDGFTSPLVADLNGDGKPEIIALGVTGSLGGSARNDARYINIYNGQTGARMYRYDFGTSYAQSSGTGYHRPPSPLAVADLDRDGMAEIVYTRPDGAVFAYKPVFNGTTITGMSVMWQATVNFKSPLTNTNAPFNVPHPYIVDINGDGIPEVIVYNKVYNGQTGALLMAWQGAALTPVYSSLAANIGLVNRTYSSPTTQTNANNIKGVAMTGRRPVNGTYADEHVTTPAIWDIDGDGIQEIITGNRIYKIQINSLTDHTQNTYTTIEGPVSVDLTENTNGNKTTHYLSDGFTRVADIDGDGYLDIIVTNPCDDGDLDTKILVYVWDPRYPSQVKAAITYYSDGAHGNYSIPFIGDINGKNDGWDGTAYTKKLPEICILSGSVQINRTTGNGGRSGIKFHPLTDDYIRQGTLSSSGTAAGWDNNQTSNSNRRFNRSYSASSLAGHIIALTYDAAATDVDDRLKLSWGMEHIDRSHSTGITLFDFDNNGTKDLCYKDETSLRVVSPAKGNNGAGRDYVTNSETATTPGTSIMFSTPETNNNPNAVFGGTGFEYPVIADVNLDGSADILVTRSSNSQDIDASQGYIMVFEYSGEKWAPCPPVWNQNLYNPLFVNEDLTVPVHPQSLLTQYQDGNGNTITPYNGAWIQQPIVKEEEDYVPVVRMPEAVLRNMVVTVQSTTSTRIDLTIYNGGTASIGDGDPITFYNGGVSGNPLASSTFIGTQNVGLDIFPNEMVTLTYYITGNFNNCLIWARIFDDNISFPSVGDNDCDTSNNTASGIDCPYLLVDTYTPDTAICGYEGSLTLSVRRLPSFAGYQHTPVFQWYKNYTAIPNATDSILEVTEPGEYNCYVADSLCFKRTSLVTITRDTNCYMVRYKPNSPISAADVTQEASSAYVIINKPVTFTHNTGYFFTGWNTAANGTGTAYTVGQVFNITFNLTLYAQWINITVSTRDTAIYCNSSTTVNLLNLASTDAAYTLEFSLAKNFLTNITPPNAYTAPSTGSKVYVRAYDAISNMYSDIDSIIITVNAVSVPAVSITASDTAICDGLNVVFTANPVNAIGSPTYIWKNNGVTISSGTSPTFTYVPSNGDVITCEMRLSGYCPNLTAVSTPITMIVRQYVVPSITISVTPN